MDITATWDYTILNDTVFGLPPSPPPQQDSEPDRQIVQTTATFTCFPHLPAELRHQIWRCCLLPNGRLVTLFIGRGEHWFEPEEGFYKQTNKFGRIISNYPYEIRVNEGYYAWFLAMLLVNREASDILHSRYRLQMKATTRSGGIRLYIDPETDIVEVFRGLKNDMIDPSIGTIIAFLHDTVANDPRGQGIAHLAIGPNDLHELASARVEKSEIDPIPMHTISTLLSKRLKTFYSVIFPGEEARSMQDNWSWRGEPCHHNRSYPIIPIDRLFPESREFTILPEDTRPIELDLAHVDVGDSPRDSLYSWYHFLAKFGVVVDPARPLNMNIRYLLSVRKHIYPDPPPVRPETRLEVPSCRTAYQSYLLSADTRWVTKMREGKNGSVVPYWGEVFESEEEYARSRRELHDVAGAWIFGPDVFGEIPYKAEEEDPEEGPRYDYGVHGPCGYGEVSRRQYMVLDLSKQPRPELMVFRL